MEKLEKKLDGFITKVEEQFESLAVMVKNGFDEIHARLDRMDERFDRIENISIKGHDRRIEILEDKVGVINKKLGLKRN